MSGARALGEFGATITFAGNLPGVTQTMPLAVYVALQSDLDAAVVLSVLLLVMSFGLLLGLRARARSARSGRRRVLELRLASRLGAFTLDVELRVADPERAACWSARAAPARPRCCACSPACSVRTGPRSRWTATVLVRRRSGRSACRPASARSATSRRTTRCSRT